MKIRFLLTITVILLSVSCSTTDINHPDREKKGILFIYPDGSMMFNGRLMNKEDVVIYPDGYGGERAGIRVFVPLHPDYFRDTIPVERKDVKVETRDVQVERIDKSKEN